MGHLALLIRREFKQDSDFLLNIVHLIHEWSENENQSCPTLCNPTDYTVHRILQARILEWIAFPFSRGSSQPRNWTGVSCLHCRQILYQLSYQGNSWIFWWIFSNKVSIMHLFAHQKLHTGVPFRLNCIIICSKFLIGYWYIQILAIFQIHLKLRSLFIE